MIPLSNKFYGNSLIEYFNECKYFTSATIINSNLFYNCVKLKEIDCRNFTKWSSSTNVFRGCINLYKVILANLTGGFGIASNTNESRAMFRGCSSLKRLIFPKITQRGAFETLTNSGFNPSMYDWGPYITSFVSNDDRAIFGESCIVIIRATTPPSIPKTPSCLKLFVPAEVIDAYNSATYWSGVASKTYTIGGEEWVEQFGSANEYANLTEEEYQDNYA